MIEPPSDANGIDLVSVGETMAQVVPIAPGAFDDSSTYSVTAGGAESNVAVHLARLGLATAWVSHLGEDPLGDLVINHIARAGVDVSGVRRDPLRPTGVYFKRPRDDSTDIYYYRAGSAASAMTAELAKTVAAFCPRAVHVTGITPALSPECRQLTELVIDDAHRRHALISFDVNYRSALWPDAAIAASSLLSLAKSATVVFVGMDEAESLWSCTDERGVRALVPDPPFLVVKDGARGATTFTRDRTYFEPAHPVDVVEPVGAGDAFAAGWLAGHLRNLTEPEKLTLGHRVATSALRSRTDFGDLSGGVATLPPSSHSDPVNPRGG
ncbi:MAG: sugar kinase [Pseudolysinimonas sp.]